MVRLENINKSDNVITCNAWKRQVHCSHNNKPACNNQNTGDGLLTKTEKNDRIIRVMHNASCSKDKEQQWYIPHNHERDQSTESI